MKGEEESRSIEALTEYTNYPWDMCDVPMTPKSIKHQHSRIGIL